jgi:NAD(P)-dependent dehydrogenase (short-subunit alcohol dehydrogenase family)
MTDQTTQRVAIVTGASSGIGKETAKVLVRMGWHVIGTGRNPQRSDAAEAEIRGAIAGGGTLDFLRGDMALMAETKRIADEIKALTSRIDVLINNAGGVRDQRYITAEGTEETFTANHLAPFLLTRELLPLLKATAARSKPGDVRVIATSSLAYQTAKAMNWDDIQHLSGDFPASGVYCEAKLANVLYSHELAKRVAADGIAVQSLIPGVVHTNFASHGDEGMQGYLKDAPGKTPAEVAETLVWMATAPETGLPSARHFYDMQEQPIQPHGADDAAAARLWAESEKILAGLGY